MDIDYPVSEFTPASLLGYDMVAEAACYEDMVEETHSVTEDIEIFRGVKHRSLVSYHAGDCGENDRGC